MSNPNQTPEFRTDLYIDGAFVPATDGERFSTVNPATGEVLAEVAGGTAEDIDRAVRSGRRAFASGAWSKKAPAERKAVLVRLADLIEENAEELALTDALDGGKLLSGTSTIDIPGSAAILRWYAEAIDKLYGEIAPTAESSFASITAEPVGVVGAVIPWNYPLEMAIWKLGPALAAGNSVVLKPAEESPLSALRLGELATEAGLPAGALNVVSGLGEVAGKALGLHPDVDVIAFTGSTEVGKYFLGYAAESNMKQVWLECGGKSANVVFDDVEDLDAAADMAAQGIFFQAGQVCSANSRLLVHERIAEVFVDKVIDRARALRAGSTLDLHATLPPVITAGAKERIEKMLDDFLGETPEEDIWVGAACVEGAPEGGAFVAPTIVKNVSQDSALANTEIFGPVLSVTTFSSEEEAVQLANATPYALAASVWTDSLRRAHRMSRRLKAGTVSVNTVDALDVTVPFGGSKLSGFGRDLSLHALGKFTTLKTTWIADL